jgi:hypothetical protein
MADPTTAFPIKLPRHVWPEVNVDLQMHMFLRCLAVVVHFFYGHA